MRDISMHIMDIVMNSLAANASLIEVIVEERAGGEDVLGITIIDNGKGMDSETVKQVVNPFVTSRTTRKVGLGLPLLKAASERSGGTFFIKSEPGKGTTVKATFQYGNIDRPPMGKVGDTILGLIVSNPSVDLVYRHSIYDREFRLDTREMRRALQEVPLDSPEVISWMSEYIKEGLKSIKV